MFLTDSLVGDLVTSLITLTAIVIVYYKQSFQYWKKRNVPSTPASIPFGHITGPFSSKEHIGVQIKRIYDQAKRNGWTHAGLYFLASPAYLVMDLDHVKNVMTKDFHHFQDRGLYYNEKDDPLSAHLFNIDGPKWKNLRTKLTPTFTSGKMKTMFSTLIECESNLRRAMSQECQKPVDIKDILQRFTTDIIGSCAFGLDCKTFEEDSPFRELGRKIFTRTPLRRLKRSFALNFPTLAKKLGVALIPKELSNFFIDVVRKTVKYREENNVTRKDFMQLLIDMKNSEDSFTIEEIAAQCFVFFIAGFETSSTTMTFALYELAKNQEIQNKVRKEIEEVLAKSEGKITYDGLQEMKYLGQVIDETLRKYPPGPLIPRRCVKEYKIPDTDVVIEKNVVVIISILGIHHDKEYYPDPEKFDPDRFSEVNKNLRHSYAHIPFGEGPRNCIGMRFGLMESKVGLASLLKNFKFTVDEKTKEPLKMRANTLVLAAEGEIWLNVQKI